MAFTPYDDPREQENTRADFFFRGGNASQNDEWEEFLRIEGLKEDEDEEDIHLEFLNRWMFWL